MAAYNPPTAGNELQFNPNNFQSDQDTITITDADRRYFRISGGVVNGSSTFSAGLNITGNLTIGSSILTSTQVDYLTGITTGTATASKALVVDSSKNIISINDLAAVTLTGGATTQAALTRVTGSGSVCYIQAGAAATSNSAQDLFFGNYLTAYNTSNRRLMFKANGNFGIGTYLPNDVLSVNGTMRIIGATGTAGAETEYARLIPTSTGNLNIICSTGGVTTRSVGIGANNNWATLDLGNTYNDRQLSITNVSTEYYGFGTAFQVLKYFSKADHTWYTGTTQASLGTQSMKIDANANLTVVKNFIAPTGGLHAYGFDSTGLNSYGGGVHMHYGGSFGQVFSYNYSTANYLDLSLGEPNSLYIKASNKFVGIGTDTPLAPLHVVNTAAFTNGSTYGFLSSSGAGSSTGFTNRLFSIYSSGALLCASGEIDCFSDLRLKKDVEPLPKDICAKLLEVDPIQFYYQSDIDSRRLHYGFGAQQLIQKGFTTLVGFTQSEEPLEPEDIECDDGSTVHLEADQRLTVCALDMIPMLLQLIKIQEARISVLEREIWGGDHVAPSPSQPQSQATSRNEQCEMSNVAGTISHSGAIRLVVCKRKKINRYRLTAVEGQGRVVPKPQL